MKVPLIEGDLVDKVLDASKQVPKSGMHNPLKNPERYLMWGNIFFNIAAEMRKPEVQDYLVKLVQRCMPKSHQ